MPNYNNLRNFINYRLAQAVTPEEAEQAGQMYRGDMPRENYGPSLRGGEGKVYNTPIEQMSPSYRPMSPRELHNRQRDRWLYENSPNATPEDLREFGLDSQGRRIRPPSQGDMWKDLDRLVPTPLTRNQIDELHRSMQRQDLDRVPKQRTSPFAPPTEQELQNYKQNHPLNRARDSIWSEMKNWR